MNEYNPIEDIEFLEGNLANTSDYPEMQKDLDMAVQRLKKHVRMLCDKATPKNPVSEAMPGFTADQASHLVCPGCKQSIVNVWSQSKYHPQYCHYCGQALDWSDDQ